jgi:hypothetical protein
MLNVSVGAILIPIALGASRRYVETLVHHPLAQKVARDLAGASLSDARDQLASLAAFEREDE